MLTTKPNSCARHVFFLCGELIRKTKGLEGFRDVDKSAHRMAVGKLTGGEQQQRRRGGRRGGGAILRCCRRRGDDRRLRQANQIIFAASNVTPIAKASLVLEIQSTQ